MIILTDGKFKFREDILECLPHGPLANQPFQAKKNPTSKFLAHFAESRRLLTLLQCNQKIKKDRRESDITSVKYADFCVVFTYICAALILWMKREETNASKQKVKLGFLEYVISSNTFSVSTNEMSVSGWNYVCPLILDSCWNSVIWYLPQFLNWFHNRFCRYSGFVLLYFWPHKHAWICVCKWR